MTHEFVHVICSFFVILAAVYSVTSKGISFPHQRDAIALGVACVNPDKTRGTCEAYNECASFSIRSYIRGETGVCGFMPNGDPAVCCQIISNTRRPEDILVNPGNTNTNNKRPSAPPQPQPSSPSGSSTQQQQPPTIVIPGINVNFDPDLGDLARIRNRFPPS
ncbi:unnamed protein product [Notodromas monacha]|uniref:Clip domain-containing protein n=1 Tax=Notodromas monacha TaxID=399045 RepID=A0A7R9BU37_9CRUS|nr:unnamed protein product [Notodromas monacha]CAG0921773.1 unnamed protein product [Notodromas monacha]